MIPTALIIAYINQHIALVRFDPSKTSGKFVSYFLASEKPQKLFRASTDVGAKAGMSLLTVQKLQLALPSPPEQRAIAERQKQQQRPATPAPAAPACPQCGKPMALRTARQGQRAGSQFWGCSGYPECKGTRPLEASDGSKRGKS